MKKKILSLALTICMIMSLVPVISASAESGQAYQLVYDFKNIEEFANGNTMVPDNVRFDTTDGTFAFHSWYGLDDTDLNPVTYKSGYGIEIKTDGAGDYFAVKINVPYEGNYSAILDYYQYVSGDTTADVYLVSENTADITRPTETEKIDDIGKAVPFAKAEGANTVISADAVEMNLPAGEHILVFKVTKADGNSSQKRIRPSKLTLTSGTPAEGDSYAKVPMYMEASVEEAELKVGESATLTVSGWMNDGTAFDEASNTVSFVSKNGKVSITDTTATAISEGTDIITATVTSGGKSISKDIAVTVLPASPAYELVYDFKNTTEYKSGSPIDCDNINFNSTKGTWSFHSKDGLSPDNNGNEVLYKNNWIEIRTDGVGDYFAAKINVPYKAEHSASLNYYQYGSGSTTADVYLVEENTVDITKPTEAEKVGEIATSVPFAKASGAGDTGNVDSEPKKITIPAGKHILVFKVTSASGGSSAQRIRPNMITLTSGTLAEGASYATVPMYISEAKANDAELETGGSTALEVSGWFNDGTTFDETSVSFSTESGNISMDGNTVTANSAGTATVTASVTSGEKTLTKNISIAVNLTAQEMVNAAFNAAETTTQYSEPSLNGLTIGGKVIDGVPNGDGSFNITAPAAKENGSKFLYWAKALNTKKTILLYKTNELKNYFPGENGRELLIAVYADEVPTTVEYYNANGQLIPGATSNDRPYMAGYGNASGWNRYGNTNIYVAEYNNKTQPDNVTVTVVNGDGTDTVPYGEKVTCTADAANGTFRWWQKDVNGAPEIVSVDESYSFLAYENCIVTAVYGETEITVTNPAKIIIDTFGENSIMAEFIGFENKTVFEKGIMFGENRIAMTGAGNQFTVTADKNGTFKGYAIVKDGDNYKLITDGEVTINNLAE